MNNKKIAVLFPGIGYNNDRPLLYYTGKIAANLGYEIRKVEYGGIDKACLKDKEKMPEAFKEVMRQTKDCLFGIGLEECSGIIFISKSVGTVAASMYAKEHGIRAKQVYYTPLGETFSYVTPGEGIVFFGSSDPWIVPGTVKDLCIKNDLPFEMIENANHSLETGDVLTDVTNLKTVLNKTESYLNH